jgi:hypothetical protein
VLPDAVLSAVSHLAAHLAMGYTVFNVTAHPDNQGLYHLRASEIRDRQSMRKTINSYTPQSGRKGEASLPFETGGYASLEEALTHSAEFLQFLHARNAARGRSHHRLPPFPNIRIACCYRSRMTGPRCKSAAADTLVARRGMCSHWSPAGCQGPTDIHT